MVEPEELVGEKIYVGQGTAYPGPPMVNYNSDGTCKTGKVCGECNEHVPSGEFVIGGGAGSLLGEHVMTNGFVTDTTFLKDVKEGKTYAEAVEAEGGRAYYKALQPWLFTMSNINVVDVDVEGVTKQKVSFATSGLNILANVKNMGTFSTEACGSSAGQLACPDGLDADDLHLVVLSPENFDTEGGSISIPTGKFTVLGGTNAGKISVTTTDAVRIFDIENSGEATFENSDDLYVSSMPNSGKVLFKNTHGVFLDIVNEA